jgi:REP element-mobilizing transposase RayT
MTCTVLHWIPVFTRPPTVQILLDSLTYLQQNDSLKLYAYVIMENHLHLVAQSDDIAHSMARFKSYTAKRLITWLEENRVRPVLEQLAFYKKAHKHDRAYQFWQEGVHPEAIDNIEVLRQKVEYIHRNPVDRGHVAKPEHWRYSSAQNYSDELGLIEVFRDW